MTLLHDDVMGVTTSQNVAMTHTEKSYIILLSREPWIKKKKKTYSFYLFRTEWSPDVSKQFKLLDIERKKPLVISSHSVHCSQPFHLNSHLLVGKSPSVFGSADQADQHQNARKQIHSYARTIKERILIFIINTSSSVASKI